MLNTDEANALAKWIQNWKKTYNENPKLNECITWFEWKYEDKELSPCLLYTSPSPRDGTSSRMPSSA